MEKLQGTNQPFWKATAQVESYPKLANDIEVDIAVVGGGISGVLTAYFLAKEGKTVALVEAEEIASGTTGGTTAKLSSQHQLIYSEMMERDGKDVAKKYYDANQAGIELIKSLIDEFAIDCDFKKMDAYVFSQDGSDSKRFEREAKAYKELGIDGELAESISLDIKVASAIVMRNQAQFHPVKFLHGILREFEKLGGKIIQHTRYMDSEIVEGKLLITTDTPFTVTCEKAVLATLFPVEDPDSFYSNTLKPVTSHLVAMKSDESFDKGMYISEDTPKRTFRGAQGDRQHVLVVGGNTHPTGDGHSTVDHYQSIQAFAKKEFGLAEMISYWSEHDLVSPDRRPFIGPIEEGDEQFFVMTGYSKWGLAAAATGAQLITDLICENENPYEQLFSPSRNLPDEDEAESEEDEVDEELDVHSVAEMAAELKIGEAKRFEEMDSVLGMYKDTNETIHYLDLSCTHLGCEVTWNDGDATWDCPCHGSIFDGNGEVLAGPAKVPLKKVDPF